MSEAEERTRAIRAHALELGFHKVGFAPAGPADPDGRLRAWLDRGYGGELAYMARTAIERADPRALVEGARALGRSGVDLKDTSRTLTE